MEFVDGQLLRTKEPLTIFTKTLHHRCLTGSFEYTSEADKALTQKKLATVKTILHPAKLKFVSATNICFYAFMKALRMSRAVTLREVPKCEAVSGSHFPAFILNTGKYGPETTPYLTLFTQCKFLKTPVKSCLTLS